MFAAAMTGAIGSALLLLAIIGFFSLLKVIKELNVSVTALSGVVKPLLDRADLQAAVSAMPIAISELRRIALGLEGMNSALAVFNRAFISKEAMGDNGTGPPEAVVVPYTNEEAAAENEAELQRMLRKIPPTK